MGTREERSRLDSESMTPLPSAEEFCTHHSPSPTRGCLVCNQMKDYGDAVLEAAAVLADKEGIVTGIGHAIRKLKDEL